MCAINGCTLNNEALVSLMNDATKHRGPDGSKILGTKQFCFGHNRLAIIELSPDGLQPRISNDGRYTIVFNGEIYNYQELKNELSAQYDFKSKTDTEVLLAAYAVWGVGMFPRLRGIFAFAIFDSKNNSLLLARDHMGVKPLYYYEKEGELFFSSEMQGLLAIVTEKNINESSLKLYLGMQYVPSPTTLVKGIQKLQPGHMLTWGREKGAVIERYFYPAVVTKKAVTSNQICVIIDQAVKRQLVSDRPIGTFLSGGIDSSIVLHHMSKHSQSVKTFSVDFEMVAGAEKETEKFNTDAALAERTASVYGAHHTTFHIGLDDIRNNLENIFATVDEPVANPTVISQYFLSQWVREQGVVVALGGDGGDELFGGYTRHRAYMAAYYFQHLPKIVQHGFGKLHPKITKLRSPLPLGLHRELMLNKEKFVSPLMRGSHSAKIEFNTFFGERYKRLQAATVVDAFHVVDRETWLADESLARSDRTSMLHGVELRVPLLDLDVVELADTIPIWKKTSPFLGKIILRNAYKNHLPKYLFEQPKRGWISPGAKWLRDPKINSFAKEVLTSSYHDGFDQVVEWAAVQKMLEEHTIHGGYYLNPLWNLLQLQIWGRKHQVHV